MEANEFGTVLFCLFFRSVWAKPGSKRSGSGFDSRKGDMF